MRIAERKLRRVIRSIIAESHHEIKAIWTAKDCLEDLVNTGTVGFGGEFEGPIHLSKVYEMCKSAGVSKEDIRAAINDNPNDYEIRGSMVHFLGANKLDTITPEDEELMSALNPSKPYSYGQR